MFRDFSFLHIYPTLCELCGVSPPKSIEGVSFVSLLKDPEAAWSLPAITTHGRGNHAVRSERFRYIRYADGSEELYDHEADPMEWKNLAGDPTYNAEKLRLASSIPRDEAPSLSSSTGGNDDDDPQPGKPKRKKQSKSAAVR